jgi:hypothetical protein
MLRSVSTRGKWSLSHFLRAVQRVSRRFALRPA